jgi:O-antigen ligase
MFSEESKLTGSFADRWAPRFLYTLIVLQAVPFFGLPTGLDWPGLRRLNFYKLIVIVLLLGLLSTRLDRVRTALRSRTRQVALGAALAIWVGLFLGSVAYHPGLRSNLEIFLLYWTPSLLVFAYLLLLYPAIRRQALVLSLAGFYLLALIMGYFEWLTWKTPAFDAFFLQFREQPHFWVAFQILPRLGGTLGPMGLGEVIVIGLPIVAGFALQAFKTRYWVRLTLIFLLFCMGLVLLLLTFTRHPLLVVPVELLVFVSFTLAGKRHRKFLLVGGGAILGSVLLGLSLLVAQGPGRIILARYFALSETGKDIQSPTDPSPSTLADKIAHASSRSLAHRTVAYKVSWGIIRDQPWTGVGMGPEAFVHYWKKTGPHLWRGEQLNPITHAHNFYVQMFVSGGLLAGLGFFCLVLLILRKGWQVWRRGRLSGEPLLSPLEIGVLTAVVGVFVSMLLDFKYNLQWSTLILWVLLGTVILILDNPEGQDSSHAATGEKPAEAAPES